MDEPPSPARRAVAPAAPARDGLQPLDVRELLVNTRVAQLTRENAELRQAVAQLNARLYRANEARERWLLRQDAWRRERAELLARLDGDGRRR